MLLSPPISEPDKPRIKNAIKYIQQQLSTKHTLITGQAVVDFVVERLEECMAEETDLAGENVCPNRGSEGSRMEKSKYEIRQSDGLKLESDGSFLK